MPASPINLSAQFTRQFGVPIDRDFVFATTLARTGYLVDAATSGLAYTGMIVADLQTNKAYLLNSSRQWVEVGATAANDLFSGSGMLFRTGSTQDTFKVGGLSSGNNIVITNPSGLSAGNPTIGLSSSLTGISSIYALNNNSSISGFQLTATTGSFDQITVKNLVLDGSQDVNFSGTFKMSTLFMEASTNVGMTAKRGNAYITAPSGTTYVRSSGISLIADPLVEANGDYAGLGVGGPINISGSSVNIGGQTNFNTTPKVNNTPVSLSGHQHVYSDITDFCDGVSSCVTTSLTASSGVTLAYNIGQNSLNVQLTGQALALHNYSQSGLIARTSDGNFTTRTISSSGNNILIGNGNGAGNNPSVGLNPVVSIDSLSVTSGINIGTNLVVEGNLIVNGDTIVTNVSTIEVEDPTIRVGATSGTLASTDTKDRGIEFVYQNGNTVPITGFFGYDHSANAFTFLTGATNTSGIYSGGSVGNLNVGGLFSSGRVSGTVLTSTVSNGTAPIVVSSTDLVSNLNSDLLDGEHGSYYRNSANLSGTINRAVLPVATTTSAPTPSSGIALFNDNHFVFDSAGIVSTKNTVYTSGSQRVSGVKSFANTPIFENGSTASGITSIVAASSANTTTYFPVFSGSDPATSSQSIVSRTLQNVRNDLGSTAGGTGTLVLRDTTNGGFTAGTITATGFVGYGGGITGLYADNISSGTLASGILPTVHSSAFTINASSPVSGYNFVNNISVDRAGRVTSATSGRLPIATVNDIGLAKFSSTNFNVDANGTVSIANNGITLGTHTSGQYTKSVSVQGTGLTISNDSEEGLGYTITSNATASSVTGTIVARDSSGNFGANLINVASISGSTNATSPAGGTTPTYTSTSISGINNSTYLLNFIIDGGTP